MKARSLFSARGTECRLIALLMLGDAAALAQVPESSAAPSKAVPPPVAPPQPSAVATAPVAEDNSVLQAPVTPAPAESAPQFAMPQILRPRIVAPPLAAAEQSEPPPPAGPPKTHYPFGLEFDVMPVWQTNKGFDLFSNNDVSTRIGLSLNAELGELAPKTPLLVELGWSTESQASKTLFGQFATELSAHNFHTGLKLMHRVLPFLAPHLRLAGGATWLRADYSVASSTTSREFENHEWLAFGMLGAGVTATVPTQVAVQPGLVVEGGYLLSSSMTLRLSPKENQNALVTSGATLGTLERSGPYLRFGIFIRY